MIEILIDPSVSEHAEPEFQEFAKQMEVQFTETRLCIHEATHVLYSRACGFFPRFYGPHWSVLESDGWHIWNSQKHQGRERSWSNGVVDMLPKDLLLHAPSLLVAKVFLAPAIIEEALWPEQHDQIVFQSESDRQSYLKWFKICGLSPVATATAITAAITAAHFSWVRASVLQDLRRPDFRQELFFTAIEYECKLAEDVSGNCLCSSGLPHKQCCGRLSESKEDGVAPVAEPQSAPKPEPKQYVGMKGRDRNSPCQCGSGKKLKRCCAA